MTRELIEKDAARRIISSPRSKEQMLRILENLPPVKADPIKHGQWLSVKVMDDEADFGETDGAECSACGYTTINEYWAKTYYHYCPNCGAKMDEVKNG